MIGTEHVPESCLDCGYENQNLASFEGKDLKGMLSAAGWTVETVETAGNGRLEWSWLQRRVMVWDVA